MVFTILSTSSSEGGENVAVLKARLIGSNSRDRDFDRYAVSNAASVSRRAFSELKVKG